MFHLFGTARLQRDFDRQERWISAGLTGWHKETAESLERVTRWKTHTQTNCLTLIHAYYAFLADISEIFISFFFKVSEEISK